MNLWWADENEKQKIKERLIVPSRFKQFLGNFLFHFICFTIVIKTKESFL